MFAKIQEWFSTCAECSLDERLRKAARASRPTRRHKSQERSEITCLVMRLSIQDYTEVGSPQDLSWKNQDALQCWKSVPSAMSAEADLSIRCRQEKAIVLTAARPFEDGRRHRS